MSRRTFHRASEAERREDLIAATLDCIAEFGIQGATVRQIATRAGVTGGLIRHYFASKDLMMQAAYREVMRMMSEPAYAAADGDGTAREKLVRFIAGNLTPPVTDPRMLSLWAAFIGHIRVEPEFAAIHRENYIGFLAVLEGLLSAFFAEQGRPIDTQTCRRHAIALNGLIDGLWLEGTLVADMFSENQLADTALTSVERLLGLSAGELSAANRT
ncbi:TetR family transcriptional regulator C-terminal domain-containing protein [Rhizobium sp. CSW-27]|uniref:TetR family transcriptional regulator C-terminal domain-containing protein n=1 Tax=Rhizobium sp. CSW-27 TaxID=2839985 RepID=UPI001C02358C|nr:TetR family transcriptional regulator C-terminal domain-containing protein [Rhizobium sp. CSW-27]